MEESLSYTVSVAFEPEDISQVGYWAEVEGKTPERFIYEATIAGIVNRIEKDLREG